MNKVSVIIPSYGSGSNPIRAVKSVLSQDYTDVEVVFVDDNGEGTEQQVRNRDLLMSNIYDKRFIYYAHKKNCGGSAARNTGASIATGDYLCFLDDDDEFAYPDKISKQMAESIMLDDAWAGTYGSLNIYKDGILKERIEANISGNMLEEYLTRNDISIGTASPIITKKSFDSINGFDPTFKRHQDWEFFARLLDKYKLKAVPEAEYNRIYKNNVTKKSAEIRKEYMDHYVEKMMSSLSSIDEEKKKRIFNDKYLEIFFAYLGDRKIKSAITLYKSRHYPFHYCFYVVSHCVTYLINKVVWYFRRGLK